MRKICATKKRKDGTTYEQNKPVFPSMVLYEEIIFLQYYFKGIYVVENVVPYYEPLIEPQKLGRHCFWSNIKLPNKKFEPRGHFDDLNGTNKRLLLRNCVEPEVGKYIMELVECQFSDAGFATKE